MTGHTAVEREISEAEMTNAFAGYVRGLGIKPTGLAVQFRDEKMIGSAKSLKWRMFGVGGFTVTGTFTAQDGALQFVLEDVSSGVPWAGFVAPRIDDIVAELVGDLEVTGVEIREGTLVVSGVQK